MRIPRHPWTSSLIETFHSRIFELYINQNFPTEPIEYVGRDFPLSSESEEQHSLYKQSHFIGTLTQNPLRFLDQMSDISGFIGVQLGVNGSVAHKEFGIRHLFQSETFCRELRAQHIGCRDSETKRFLDDHEIPSVLIGCVSSLLGKLDFESQVNQNHHEVLLIDLTPDLEQVLLESKFDDMSYVSISTRTPEVFGEHYRTSMVDLLISQMHCSEIVITSNIDLAIPAVALGKKTLLINQTKFTDEYLNDFVTSVNAEQIVGSISWAEIEKLLNLVPLKYVEQMASAIEGFIANTLRAGQVIKPNLSVSLFKEQVLSEVINSQLMQIRSLKVVEEQMEGLLNSRSWKVTVLLRKFSDWSRKFSQPLRSRSGR